MVLAIEVSETTLAIDRTVKAAIYAMAGVQEYWIANLPAQHIEVHLKPSDDGYASIERYGKFETIRPTSWPGDVLVSDLLPK